MLQQVDHYIATQRFTTPKHANAYDILQAILKLDPNNQQAIKGIDQVVDGYFYLAQLRLKNNQIKLAQLYIKKGLEIRHQHPGLIKLKNLVNKMIDSEQKVVSELPVMVFDQ